MDDQSSCFRRRCQAELWRDKSADAGAEEGHRLSADSRYAPSPLQSYGPGVVILSKIFVVCDLCGQMSSPLAILWVNEHLSCQNPLLRFFVLFGGHLFVFPAVRFYSYVALTALFSKMTSYVTSAK